MKVYLEANRLLYQMPTPLVYDNPYIHLHVRGRGGNQLFQLAASTILARQIGCDLKINFEDYGWMFYDVFDYNVPYGNGLRPYAHLDCQIITNDNRNEILNGVQMYGSYAFGAWFENWTFLKNDLETIKNMFTLKTAPILVPETLVHIRLGDIAHHVSSIPEYPHRIAEEIAQETTPIVILSDSLDHPYVEYCCNVLRNAFPNRDVLIAPKMSDSSDFIRMIQCSHLVGTNSTFVFWAGLLGSLNLSNKKTTVYISDKMYAQERTKALYRDDPPSFCKVIELD